MDIRLAHDTLTVEQAIRVCRWYARRHGVALRYYDFGGTSTPPHPHDTVDLSDAGRLVVLSARLTADDVAQMIDAGAHADWSLVTHTDDLVATEELDDLLARAEALFLQFLEHGGVRLGRSRTHKLLHLKRPAVYPIVDGVAREAYQAAAEEEARERHSLRPLYWPPMASDMRSSAEAYDELRAASGDARLAALSTPRLADLLVWSLYGPEHLRARQIMDETGAMPGHA